MHMFLSEHIIDNCFDIIMFMSKQWHVICCNENKEDENRNVMVIKKENIGIHTGVIMYTLISFDNRC